MGQTGWTGDLCQAETIGIATQTVASHETQSGHLPGSAWRCFVMSTPPDAEWHYLAVELKHTYPEGDPDLYGLFVNATHPTYPSGTTRGYDFREISSSSYRTVTVTARKEEHHRDATGVYLCIEAYGDHNTTFELQAAFSECPAAFVSPPGASRDAGGSSLSVHPSRATRNPRARATNPRASARAASTTTTRTYPPTATTAVRATPCRRNRSGSNPVRRASISRARRRRVVVVDQSIPRARRVALLRLHLARG